MQSRWIALRRQALALVGSLAAWSGVQALEPVTRLTAEDQKPAVAVPRAERSDRLIVRWRGASEPVRSKGSRARVPVEVDASVLASRVAVAQAVARDAHLGLSLLRQTAQGAHVLKLDRSLPVSELQALAAALRAADPSIEHAQVDRRMRVDSTPNDPYFDLQWPLWEPVGGIRARTAWNRSEGSNVVVAVIDTGVRPHNDVAEALVPGYDFISDTAVSNDGDGRDADAIDPGDWTEDDECGDGYAGEASTWHGTHVSGTIAARADNFLGVAGVAYDARIQPVRVLGKCGGYESDIADAMVWAAGGTVAGVPANATPARVLNLSLGGGGACSEVFQGAVDAARAKGAVVVVAAGNSAGDVSEHSPANCSGVIAVGAHWRSGAPSYFSNFGTGVALSAPGGDMSWSDDDGVLSTVNTGLKGPVADGYAYYQGTSMAAPHVAGVAALLLSVKPTLTPDQVADLLKLTARPFPRACYQCGRGLLDAQLALKTALGTPIAEVPEVEGNDTAARANRQRRPVVVKGSVGSASDTDWYRIDLKPGRRLSAMLSPAAADADYDLYVYDGQGKIVSGSRALEGWDDSLQYVNLTSRTQALYVRVLYYGGSLGNYRLKLFF